MTERRDSEEEEPLVVYLPPGGGRAANPNTPEGEIQAVSAFAAGIRGASPARRVIAKAIVWLLLIGMALSILAAVVNLTRML